MSFLCSGVYQESRLDDRNSHYFRNVSGNFQKALKLFVFNDKSFGIHERVGLYRVGLPNMLINN